jgi:hypothetical protein
MPRLAYSRENHVPLNWACQGFNCLMMLFQVELH